MSHLGFTFYPKDWWTSDSFYILSPFERYIYLELLFMMYDNEGSVIDDKARIERRLCTTIKDDVWSKITDLMVKDGDRLTHKSVNKRLAKIIASRENGRKGGAPKGNSNARKQPKQPKQPKKTTQNNPPLEIETETKTKIETKRKVIKENIPKGYESFCFDFLDSEFENCFLLWLEYKKKKRQSYKTQKSLELCYQQLLKLSANNPISAQAIIEKSMANNWDGIFPLKNNEKVKDNEIDENTFKTNILKNLRNENNPRTPC